MRTVSKFQTTLIFVGGENGAISPGTALLKQMMENPEIAFAVRDMPLPEALNFLFGASMSPWRMSTSCLTAPRM